MWRTDEGYCIKIFGGDVMGRLSARLRNTKGGGIAFFCPGCDDVHVVRITSETGSNWGYNGDPEKPTFTPSVLVTAHANPNAPEDSQWRKDRICHSFVTGGRIQFLGDCTHDLAGHTVELPTFPYSDDYE